MFLILLALKLITWNLHMSPNLMYMVKKWGSACFGQTTVMQPKKKNMKQKNKEATNLCRPLELYFQCFDHRPNDYAIIVNHYVNHYACHIRDPHTLMYLIKGKW